MLILSTKVDHISLETELSIAFCRLSDVKNGNKMIPSIGLCCCFVVYSLCVFAPMELRGVLGTSFMV